MSTTYLNVDPIAPVRCDNCGWVGMGEHLGPVHDIHERVEPGEICPAGECPECGALAYLTPTTPKE